MDLDSRYSLVRDQLYRLGFEQPLPIGSLPIVTALLESSVKTDAALRQCKDENKKLLEVCSKYFFFFFAERQSNPHSRTQFCLND